MGYIYLIVPCLQVGVIYTLLVARLYLDTGYLYPTVSCLHVRVIYTLLVDVNIYIWVIYTLLYNACMSGLIIS